MHIVMRARRKKVEGVSIDWDSLNPASEAYDAEVDSVVGTVARFVHGKYERFTDLGDLTQEARIIAATEHGDAIRSKDYGYLAFRLERDLMNHCEMAFHTPRNNAEGEVNRPSHSAIAQQGRIVTNAAGEKVYERLVDSYDEQVEEHDDDDVRIDLYPENVPGGYNAEQIRTLLPAVWDESYCYGLPTRDDAPEEGMPRAASNKARGNTHWAYIADIKSGWDNANLTTLERRALLMGFGLGWTHEHIASHEGIGRRTISDRIETGIKKIMASLNGTEEEN